MFEICDTYLYFSCKVILQDLSFPVDTMLFVDLHQVKIGFVV